MQYAATRPLLDMLLAAYPQHLDPAWFEYQEYLWATELWYSYCFEASYCCWGRDPCVQGRTVLARVLRMPPLLRMASAHVFGSPLALTWPWPAW